MLEYSPLAVSERTVWHCGRKGILRVEKEAEKEEISLGFGICQSKLYVTLLKTQLEKYIMQVL